MDEQQFDYWTRLLAAATSRRVALRTLVGSAIASGLGRLGPDEATARKKKRKKLKKNAFGCVNVGGRCRGRDSACCSGICKGKKPRKGKKDRSKCLAHNVLGCPADADECADVSVPCGNLPGSCFRTTGRASFCAVTGICTDCRKDADCGPGGACAVCPGCGGISDTACLAPGF